MVWIQFAFANIFRNKRRSFMAIVMISIASLAILLSGGFVIYSFNGLAETTIRSGVGSIQIAKHSTFNLEPFSINTRIEQKDLNNIDEILKADNNVEYSFNRTILEGLASINGLSRAVIIKATDIKAEINLFSIFSPIVSGYAPMNTEKNVFQAMVGIGLSQSLSLKIGDRITLLASTLDTGVNAIDVIITGFIKLGIPDLDSRLVMIPFGASDVLMNGNGVQYKVVVLKNLLDKQLDSLQLIKNQDIAIKSWEDVSVYYTQVKNIYFAIFTFFFIMIIFMTLISLSNIISVIVMERVKEIGTMRSFGFTKRSIAINFVLEAVILALIGLAVGLIISITTSYILANFLDIQMPPPPGMTKGYPLLVEINFFLISVCLFVIVFISCIASLFASYIAINIPIVKALSYN